MEIVRIEDKNRFIKAIDLKISNFVSNFFSCYTSKKLIIHFVEEIIIKEFKKRNVFLENKYIYPEGRTRKIYYDIFDQYEKNNKAFTEVILYIHEFCNNIRHYESIVSLYFTQYINYINYYEDVYIDKKNNTVTQKFLELNYQEKYKIVSFLKTNIIFFSDYCLKNNDLNSVSIIITNLYSLLFDVRLSCNELHLVNIIIGFKSINNGIKKKKFDLNIIDNETFNSIMHGLFWLNIIIFKDELYFKDVEKQYFELLKKQKKIFKNKKSCINSKIICPNLLYKLIYKN